MEMMSELLVTSGKNVNIFGFMSGIKVEKSFLFIAVNLFLCFYCDFFLSTEKTLILSFVLGCSRKNPNKREDLFELLQ